MNSPRLRGQYNLGLFTDQRAEGGLFWNGAVRIPGSAGLYAVMEDIFILFFRLFKQSGQPRKPVPAALLKNSDEAGRGFGRNQGDSIVSQA